MRYLTILEVSQKQAYIFSSNKLKDNIRNSDTIAQITSNKYIEQSVNDTKLFDSNKNLVYAGGGHTILVFENERTAKKVNSIVTEKVLREFPGIELFVKTVEYDEEKSAGENISLLKRELESKKAIRKASFHQGTFGIEKIDVNTGKPVLVSNGNSNSNQTDQRPVYVPKDYAAAMRFEDLGGTKGDSNFIAVVHIDGNGMGKRIADFEKNHTEWDSYKTDMRKFSEKIAEDFLEAYKSMITEVSKFLKTTSGLEVWKNLRTSNNGTLFFPIRRIITEGDDITFVTEGRIGIECARIFLEKLSALTGEDGKPYSACAGVAIVHQKFPFYRAYTLAEALCSNAKKFSAAVSKNAEIDDNGASVSSIDWHIEYGELKDTLDDTRKQYETADGKRMEMRPYIVSASEEVRQKESLRLYGNFAKLIKRIMEDEFYASSALKELRTYIKRGEDAAVNYMKFHYMDTLRRDALHDIYKPINLSNIGIGVGKSLERCLFVKTSDKKERCILFDAIELMDTFVLIG